MIGGIPTWVGGTPPLAIGDLVAGGVVFYIAPTPTDLDGNGTLDLGLVCALNNQSESSQWGCFGTDLASVPNVFGISGGFIGLGTEIGDGMTNTNDILNDCPAAPAALTARSLGTEWFLPSAKELIEMSEQKSILEGVTGFSSFGETYWTSSEQNASLAIKIDFNSSTSSGVFKIYNYKVRAVRAFQ